jgi:predicted HicB family RNase H-like nuclease
MGFNDREEKRAGRGIVAAMLETPTETEKETSAKGRSKTEREIKKRVSIAILPSLHDDIQKIAYVERKSVSEIVSQCLEQYGKKNADKLQEYAQIKKE